MVDFLKHMSAIDDIAHLVPSVQEVAVKVCPTTAVLMDVRAGFCTVQTDAIKEAMSSLGLGGPDRKGKSTCPLQMAKFQRIIHPQVSHTVCVKPCNAFEMSPKP